MRAISASLMPLISRREQRIAGGEAAGAGGLRPGKRSVGSGPVDSSSLRAGEEQAEFVRDDGVSATVQSPAEALMSTGRTCTPDSRASVMMTRLGYMPGSWVSTPA